MRQALSTFGGRWFWPFLLTWMPGLAGAAELDGSQLSPLWGLPFAGVLLSIALLPLVAPLLWHEHFGKLTAGWILAFLLPFAAIFGLSQASVALVHSLVAEYLPFIILLVALFTTSGGVYVRGNDDRKRVAHVVVFFIFTVSNAGGSLTPLGDPPLFLGFLKGVEFTWTLRHMFPETLFLLGALLAIFYAVDNWFYKREGHLPVDPTPDTQAVAKGANSFGLEGAINFCPCWRWWAWY